MTMARSWVEHQVGAAWGALGCSVRVDGSPASIMPESARRTTHMHNQHHLSCKHVLTSRLFGTLVLVLTAACSPTAAGNVVVDARSQVTPTTADLVISGTGFSPERRVEINIFDWPRSGDIGPLFVTADRFGSFSRTESKRVADVPRDLELPPIRVTVRDEATGRAAADSTSANPFVRRL